MELGLYTFAELPPDPATGRADAGRRLREVAEEILFQDELLGTEVAPIVRAELARRRAA